MSSSRLTMMPQIDDLAHWPLLRTLMPDFLRQVHSVYVFNCGKDALLFTNDNRVYAVGENENGRLGVGHKDHVTQPVEIKELAGLNIEEVCRGWAHVLLLTSSGDLYAWGGNEKGQVGCGDCVNQTRPVLVKSGVQAVKCGWNHNLLLDRENHLWTWGDNTQYQLGREGVDFLSKPALIEQLGSLTVTLFECGQRNCIALTQDSGFCVWGSFSSAELHLPTNVTLPFGLSVSSIGPGWRDFYVNDSSRVFRCNFNQNQEFECEPIEIDSVVNLVVSRWWGGTTCLLTRSGLVSVLHPDCNIMETSLTSVPDALALYGNYPETPSLTTLPQRVIRSQDRTSLSHFHDLAHFDLKLNFKFLYYSKLQHIYVNRKFASKQSKHLKEQINGPWRDQDEVNITDHPYWVYFAYIRFICTGVLETEKAWVFELLSLAIEFGENELTTACREFIMAHLKSDKQLALQCYKSNQRQFVVNYLAQELTVDNCCERYELAVEIGDQSLQERIIRFVAAHGLLIPSTQGFQRIKAEHAQNLMVLASKMFYNTLNELREQ